MSGDHGPPLRPGDERVPVVGTLVLPQLSPDVDETIIGIVTDDAVSNAGIEVLWLSDSRGVFLCHELMTDVTICVLEDLPRNQDKVVNHYALGKLIAYHLEAE